MRYNKLEGVLLDYAVGRTLGEDVYLIKNGRTHVGVRRTLKEPKVVEGIKITTEEYAPHAKGDQLTEIVEQFKVALFPPPSAKSNKWTARVCDDNECIFTEGEGVGTAACRAVLAALNGTRKEYSYNKV